jgi:hypothetical protein
MRFSGLDRRAFGSGACACLLLAAAALAGGLFIASVSPNSSEATVRMSGITPEVVYIRPEAALVAGANVNADAAGQVSADVTLSLGWPRELRSAEEIFAGEHSRDVGLAQFQPELLSHSQLTARRSIEGVGWSGFATVGRSDLAPTAGAAAWEAVSLPHVPEPSTWALVIFGLGAVAAAARKRLFV